MSVGFQLFDAAKERSGSEEQSGAAEARIEASAPQRALDIVIASLSLFLLAPLLCVVALLVRLESPGPALFRQQRGGFRGQTFEIYKFRTMTVQEDGPVVRQVSRDDHRVTRLGSFLRRTSIDELPQLLNVLKGDMSLVGPRPHALAHDHYYASKIPAYRRRFDVKPGLTGWAQVNGARGATPTVSCMQRRVEFDVWFVQHASPRLYVRILALTVLLLARERAF